MITFTSRRPATLTAKFWQDPWVQPLMVDTSTTPQIGIACLDVLLKKARVFLFLRLSTVTPYADSAEVFYAFLGAVGMAILLVGIAASMIHAGHQFNLHHAMDIPLRYVFL
jgi:hypothetical protein